MSTLSVGSLEGLSANSNVISVPTGHTLNAVDGLQIGGVAQGVATAFTPSWNNLTPGNGTEDAFYTQINDLVVVQVELIFGSTTSVTGAVSLAHPVGTARIGGNLPVGLANFVDDNGDNTEGNLFLGVNAVLLRYYNVTGSSQIVASGVTASNPHTWAASDKIRLSYVYQIS